MSPRVVGGVAVLDVSGELDLYTSPKLKTALEELLGGGHARLIVNLSETTYMDSTALRVLTAARQQTQEAGGNLGLVYAQPSIDRLMTITGLKDLFSTFSSEAAALDAAKSWMSAPPKT
ncbi:MAG TPA: STAS domain-containing protein [bacterium]|nr:STAS domain-containing protein [bacterium]